MTFDTSEPFRKDFRKLPKEVQNLFEEKMKLAVSSQLTHPSLRIKKIKGHPFIWEGSITMNYRFTFHKTATGLYLRRIGTHDMLRNP